MSGLLLVLVLAATPVERKGIRDMATLKHIKIEPQEYVALKTLRDEMKTRMDAADSDIAFQAYQEAWRNLCKRVRKAEEEIEVQERAEARKQAHDKRQARVSRES